MTDHVSPFNACATCGTSLRDGNWHPALTESTNEDRPMVYSFCDDECRAAWLANPADPGGPHAEGGSDSLG